MVYNEKKNHLYTIVNMYQKMECKPQQRHTSVLYCFRVDKLQVYNLQF